MQNSETQISAEELEETKAFLAKIIPLKLENFKHEAKIPATFADYQLCETPNESLAQISIERWVHLLVSTMLKVNEQRSEQIGSLVFDKDDPLAMDFVAAATNIRAHNF